MVQIHETMEAELWYACAGPQKSLPPLNSIVAYFPQGHIEQVASFNNQKVTDEHIPRYNLPPVLLCTLMDIKLSADQETDEVFATLTLFPLSDPADESSQSFERRTPKSKAVTFSKVLTTSDTSTHGGFSIPKRAAEDCLPPLDMSGNPPQEELLAKDLHGNEWKFKHIYRGQPKRHLLTTGWSTFVTQKRLKAGDNVIFLRGENGQMRVGVRRAPKEQSQQHQQSKVVTSPTMTIGVLAAAAHAAAEKNRFTPIYNPRSCSSEFIIPYSKYVDAVKSKFSVGQRFKMRLESQKPADRRYTGTIVGSGDYDPARWPGSPWRSLQVMWDEAMSGERQERISPWEIEPFTACPVPLPQVGARKRVKTQLNPPFRVDIGVGNSRVPLERTPECHLSNLSSVPRRAWGSVGSWTPPSRRNDTNIITAPKLSWTVDVKAGVKREMQPVFKNEDFPVCGAVDAEPRLPMRRPDPHNSSVNGMCGSVNGAGLQDFLGAMGMESRLQQQKLYMAESRESKDRSPSLGSTALQLSSLRPESFQAFPLANPLTNVDLQLTSPLADKQPCKDQPYASLLTRTNYEVGGHRPDCNISPRMSGMNSLPVMESVMNNHLCSPKVNFWERSDQSENANSRLAAPVQVEQCKIFGVPLHTPVTEATSTQSSGIKVDSSVDDVGAESNSHCMDNSGSTALVTSAKTGGPNSETAGPKSKVPQSGQPSSVRSYTKVYKEGSIGRSLDVTKFPGYAELVQEVEEMFGLKGELISKKAGWQLVYTDHEDDVLMVGDDPWVEFCKCVRSIRVVGG